MKYHTTAEVAAQAKRGTSTILHRAKVLGLKPTLVMGVQGWTTAQAGLLAMDGQCGRPRKTNAGSSK